MNKVELPSNGCITPIRMANKLHKPKTKIIKVILNPLIDEIFLYFKGPVNYTLAGYVCRIMISFLKKKPLEVM